MRGTRVVLAALAALALLLGALLIVADSRPGHRFLVNRLEALTPQSGLRIALGDIRGSIYGKMELRGLKLADPKGVFFEAPIVTLDWRPFAWVSNQLDINSLFAKQAALHRLPQLRPAKPGSPLLPDYDIRIGAFAIDQLVIGAGVNGRAQRGRVAGRADIADGRARLVVDAAASKGDRLALRLDALPDADRFDVDLSLASPARGIIGSFLGTTDPVSAQITGDGRWRIWKGMLVARRADAEVASLSLSAQSGRFTLAGQIKAEALPAGRWRALAAPALRVTGAARFADRRLRGDVALASPALDMTAQGGISFAESAFDDLLITAKLRKPSALFPNVEGRGLAFKVRLDGAFRQPGFDYLLSANAARFGTTGVEGLRASGRGRLSKPPFAIPVSFSARRITGVGDVAGGILANISVKGLLLVSRQTLLGEKLTLQSDKLNGQISLFVDLKTGRYDVGLAGRLSRLFIPGIGLVDVQSDLDVVPGPNGRGTRIIGRGEARVLRFDNGFLSSLAGGLPRLETALERTPDGLLRFTNLRITAPKISMLLSGVRRRDGSFQLSGSGTQASYGAFRLALDGPLARPQIDLVFAQPNAALGLADLRLTLDPVPSGFVWQAQGQSRLGRVVGEGGIALPAGRAAQIRVDALRAGGLRAQGNFTPVTGGLSGSLSLGGDASGALTFDVANGVQRVRMDMDVRNARFAGPPELSMARGRFAGTLLLAPQGLVMDGDVSARGVQYAGASVARLSGKLRLRGERGELTGTIAGSRGRDFALDVGLGFDPGRIRVTASGTVDNKPVRLDAPAILLKEARGWRLAPTELLYAGGRAELSGLLGGARPEITAVLADLPLGLLDIVSPRLRMGGRASGTLFYSETAQGDPVGRMTITVRGLSRAGLALTSRPIDLAVTASFGDGRAGARMVAASGGQTIGRGQVQLSGLSGSAPLGTRIANAALLGQLRYNGDAGTLWRLTGIESFDLSGPVAVGADMTGRLADPIIRGSVRTSAARVESAAAGMVLTNVETQGRFDGARLVFDRFAANAGRSGRVTGSGTIIFSAENRGLDIAVEADNAQLIARDDLGATVTGPLRIRSDGNGGTISGKVRLSRSSYVLGQSEAIAAVPRLAVREVNGRDMAELAAVPTRPWMLDIEADAPGRMMVSGMGLDSEWRASLSVKGTIFAPALTGTAELVRGGYEFAGRRFDLQRGVIRFRGESPPDPILDIVAEGDTQGLSATIRVAGTGLKPEISFASVPALPQDELLSRLLFGTSITNLSAPEAVQLAAAIASMRGGGGLNPINALRKAVGLDRLRILPGDVATGQRTSVAAGKYLSRRTFVEVITDGQGYSATRAEFQVTRWLSILSTISTIGEQSGAVRVSRDY